MIGTEWYKNACCYQFVIAKYRQLNAQASLRKEYLQKRAQHTRALTLSSHFIHDLCISSKSGTAQFSQGSQFMFFLLFLHFLLNAINMTQSLDFLLTAKQNTKKRQSTRNSHLLIYSIQFRGALSNFQSRPHHNQNVLSIRNALLTNKAFVFNIYSRCLLSTVGNQINQSSLL